MTDRQRRGTDKAETITRFFEAIVAGDSATLLEILTPDAVTRWPQSGERITGALSCVRVHENYPGGPPSYQLRADLGRRRHMSRRDLDRRDDSTATNPGTASASSNSTDRGSRG